MRMIGEIGANIILDMMRKMSKDRKREETEFENIYSGVSVMITEKRSIDEDKYKELPYNIEYVIVENMIYRRNREIDMMEFMSDRRKEEYVEEVIRSRKYDERNMEGETVLNYVCREKEERMAEKLARVMSGREISIGNERMETARSWSVKNEMTETARIIYNKLGEEEREIERRLLIERILNK